MSLPTQRDGRGPSARPEPIRSDEPHRKPTVDDVASLIQHFGEIDPPLDIIDSDDLEDAFDPIPYDEWEPRYDAPFPFYDEPDSPPANPVPTGVSLKAAVLDLFRRKWRAGNTEAMTGHVVWTHFHSAYPAITPAAVNAALFILVDEGFLKSFRLPGRETFFDKGVWYYALAKTTEGGTE